MLCLQKTVGVGVWQTLIINGDDDDYNGNDDEEVNDVFYASVLSTSFTTDQKARDYTLTIKAYVAVVDVVDRGNASRAEDSVIEKVVSYCVLVQCCKLIECLFTCGSRHNGHLSLK